MAIRDKNIIPPRNRDGLIQAETATTTTATGGSAYGYIKCTWLKVTTKDNGKLLFSFDKKDLASNCPVVFAPTLSADSIQEVYLTPYARQVFVEVLKQYGWIINDQGVLEEIPVYEKKQVYKGKHAEIGQDGSIVMVNDYIEQYVPRKYTDARHAKIYEKAALLLPYILDQTQPVYVRNNNVRWSEEDETPTDTPENNGERTAKKSSAKALGILTLLATFLTLK